VKEGEVVIIRPSNASYTLEEGLDFLKGYKSPVTNVKFTMIDESALPKAFGK